VFRPLKQLGLVSIISLIWFVVALLMLCRLIRSYIWLRHFKRKSEKVETGQVLEIMSRLKEQMGITRKTGVFISSAIHSPTSFGLLLTAIILPENLVNSSGEELEMILSHEMAHAKRHDYPVNLLQRILQSIFFFHPLFQMASHRLTREREHICDDWVIQATGKRDGYAECLIGLVENAYYPKSVSVAMMGHHHNISRRVDMIIDNSRGIVTGISRKAGVFILLVGLTLLPMLAATRLVYTVQPKEPVEFTPLVLDITEEGIDVPEEAELGEEEEGKPMEPGKRVKAAGIADLNLAAAIREAVGKPEVLITEDDLQSITELEARDNNIRDITGIERCVNLERLMLGAENREKTSNEIEDVSPLSELTKLVELSLASNKVSDVKPLSGLTNLTTLNLNNNQITDAAPLAKLTNLEILRLANNPISDVTFLSSLTNLTYVSIWDLPADNIDAVLQMLSDLPNLTKLSVCRCGITDLTPLSKLTGLTALELWINQVSDLSPLSDLTELEWLHPAGNQISDITPLAGLTNLTLLYLNGNQVGDITPVSGLTKLKTLNLKDNPIIDIKPLASLTELRTLYLSETQVSDISALSNLTNLEMLELYESEVSDIRPLSNLTDLTWLSIYGNEISDLGPLANLTNLTMLVLHDNQVSDITPLSGLTNVDTLWLQGNEIRDISPLSNLSNLLKLRLEGNDISDITPLSNLTKLLRLWLDENRVSDITPLSNLTNLTVLGLKSNQITDISSLVENPGIGENSVVELRENPLNDEAYNIHISALQGRGVRVSFDLK
jgi:internalin A